MQGFMGTKMVEKQERGAMTLFVQTADYAAVLRNTRRKAKPIAAN
jgi:hypothetical protein